MNTNRTQLSVVIPVYNDQEVLDELYKRLKNALKEITEFYEIVFIDDGSTDKSFLKLKNLHLSDSSLSFELHDQKKLRFHVQSCVKKGS